MALEQTQHDVSVSDVGEQLHRALFAHLAGQSCAQLVQVGLIMVENEEGGRFSFGDLPCDLRSDGAARTGHKDPAAGQEPVHGVQVGDYLLASEHVLDPQVTDIPQRDLSPDELGYTSEHAKGDIGVLGEVCSPPHQIGRWVADGEYRLMQCDVRRDPRQVADRPEHRYTLALAPMSAWVVIEHGDRDQARARATQHLPHQRGSRFPGTEDDHP
jgi:hypothetical protein